MCANQGLCPLFGASVPLVEVTRCPLLPFDADLCTFLCRFCYYLLPFLATHFCNVAFVLFLAQIRSQNDNNSTARFASCLTAAKNDTNSAQTRHFPNLLLTFFNVYVKKVTHFGNIPEKRSHVPGGQSGFPEFLQNIDHSHQSPIMEIVNQQRLERFCVIIC